MPPSPTLTTKLNEQVWHRLCAELGLNPDAIPVYFKKTKGQGGRFSGMYIHTPVGCRIEVYTGWDDYERDRLMSVSNELGRVVLHEARHAWQYRNWTRNQLDDVVAKEEDAIEFEDQLANYRTLVIVRRHQHNSPFSRLGAAQARVRQSL